MVGLFAGIGVGIDALAKSPHKGMSPKHPEMDPHMKDPERTLKGMKGAGVCRKTGSSRTMRKVHLILIVLGFCLTLPTYGRTWPQLALGGGYEVVLIVSNRTVIEWNGRFWLLEEKRSPWSGSWEVDGVSQSGNSFPIRVPGRGTRKVRITGDSTTRTGFLEMFGEGGLPTSGILVQFFFEYNSQGTLADSVAIPETERGNSFVFSVEKGSSVNTGIAWAPASITDRFLITLSLFDTEGNAADVVELLFDGHATNFFDEIFDQVPGEFLGLVSLKSVASMYVTVLRLEYTQGGFQLTALTPE